MFRRKFITQEDYQKAINTLDIEMVEEEEIKENEAEVLRRLFQSTLDYLITHDKKELETIPAHFKEEVDDEYANDVLKLEELIDVFILEEFLNEKPIIPMINEITRWLENSTIARSKQHRLKTLLNDIKKNRYRVYSRRTIITGSVQKTQRA